MKSALTALKTGLSLLFMGGFLFAYGTTLPMETNIKFIPEDGMEVTLNEWPICHQIDYVRQVITGRTYQIWKAWLPVFLEEKEVHKSAILPVNMAFGKWKPGHTVRGVIITKPVCEMYTGPATLFQSEEQSGGLGDQFSIWNISILTKEEFKFTYIPRSS